LNIELELPREQVLHHIIRQKTRVPKGTLVFLVGMTGFVTFALANRDKGERLKFALRLAKRQERICQGKPAKFLPRQVLWVEYRAGIASGAGSSPHHSTKNKSPQRTVLLRTVLRVHYLPTENTKHYRQKTQKPQIDFLRFLCYNKY